MLRGQTAPEARSERRRNVWHAGAFLPIAKRVGFFLGGSPALELASSSFCLIEKKGGDRVRGAGTPRGLRIDVKAARGRNEEGLRFWGQPERGPKLPRKDEDYVSGLYSTEGRGTPHASACGQVCPRVLLPPPDFGFYFFYFLYFSYYFLASLTGLRVRLRCR